MSDLFASLAFPCGIEMRNRFMLAPMTNLQSHDDGILSDEEYRWLVMRAEGGFGATMTCASHVQANGKGFPGQLGCFSDDHLPGLTRLAQGIKQHDSLAILQLHHAGMRSPEAEIGEPPVCPSADAETGARELSVAEVEGLREAFIAAAVRAKKAGFDGVELHGAHGYLLCQFLSPGINRRADRYGGSAENRARLVHEIIAGVRDRCGAEFLLGLRLSPEGFDLQLPEIRGLAVSLCEQQAIDFLDMSLWNVYKKPAGASLGDRSLLAHFADFDRGNVKLGVAGKIRSARDAQHCMNAGVDFVLPGRSAILHHDLPRQVQANPDFTPLPNPVSEGYLSEQGLGPKFITYMKSWSGFVEEASS